jgi:5-methylcytosine-specific restriction enzyme A
MVAVLGTWNPARWNWQNLETVIEATANGRVAVETWSVSNRRYGIQTSDRFFLLKVGRPPRGIVGRGLILSEPYSGPHWDGTPGRTTQLVDVEFDRVIDPGRVLPVSILDAELPHTNWKPQASGTTIRAEDVDVLEDLWKQHISQL